MPDDFQPLAGVVHAKSLDSWKERNEAALATLAGSRYPKRLETAVKLRAPAMRGSETNVPYAAYIHPDNPDSGGYGGMSFALFPVPGQNCLVSLVIGTQGLAPDEAILGRPGHARKAQAIADWLNQRFGGGSQVAWAKQDPTRTDIAVPDTVRKAWSEYDDAFGRYGKHLYFVYRPTEDQQATTAALAALLDLFFEERGVPVLAHAKADADTLKTQWFGHLMPAVQHRDVASLLAARRFVILQGPPGTGKTRMARQLLEGHYRSFGRSVQFHPSTTYENVVGGLAPLHEEALAGEGLGFRFAPKRGLLMEVAAEAAKLPDPYLLHVDEINRADLSKVLGEAIFLLEPNPESRREIELPFDFGPPFHRRFWLPDNLHILGTMNSADRSIAIVDVAVRRRFGFITLWPDMEAVSEHACPLAQEAYRELLSVFIEHAPEEALPLVPGHSYFLEKDEDRARLKLRSGLTPLLQEYLAQGYVSGFAEPIRAYMQWLNSR